MVLCRNPDCGKILKREHVERGYCSEDCKKVPLPDELEQRTALVLAARGYPPVWDDEREKAWRKGITTVEESEDGCE